MWEGIEVQGSGSISIAGGPKINDVYTGIHIVNDGTLSCDNTNFANCYVGILFGSLNSFFSLNPTSPTVTSFKGNRFYSNRQLYNKIGNPDLNLDKTEAGAYATDCRFIGFYTDTNENQFYDIRHGYKILNSHFGISSSSFKNCDVGIYAKSTKKGLYKIASIYMNHFEQVGTCMNLYNVSSYIVENTIGDGNDNGIIIKHARGNYIEIRNNEWNSFFRDKAFQIEDAVGLAVYKIVFYSEDYYTANHSISNSQNVVFSNNHMSPTDIINCENSILIENYFDFGDLSTVIGGYKNAIHCNLFSSLYTEASPKATYSCNEFDANLDVALEFSNNNMMSSLSANTFRSPETGLLLSGNDTQIGLQFDKGNLWKGSYSDKGAKANSGVNENLRRFIVTNENQEYPTHGPSGFFINNSDKDPEICIGDNEGEGPGADFIPTWIGEEHGIKCIDSLFNGSQFTNITPEGKWVALYILVKLQLLNENPPAVLPDCFQEITDLYQDADEAILIRAIRLIENRDVDYTTLPI
ncbi:MAG: hypothetical protein ACI86M_001216 [Saprospiraceae bacterium]|jgi:hypothetical protein